MKRRTLKAPVTFSGVGVFFGKLCSVSIYPTTGTGIVINGTLAVIDNVVRLMQTTGLVTETQGIIFVIEHLMATLYLLGIDDAEIHVVGGEIPIMDGSAAPIYALLRDSIVENSADRLPDLRLKRPVNVTTGAGHIVAVPAFGFGGLRVAAYIDFPQFPAQICDQFANAIDSEVLSAIGSRTFSHIDTIRDVQETDKIWRAVSRDNYLTFDANGVFDSPFRCKDEPAKHKWIDTVGDLALLGRRLNAFVYSHKGGHALNHRLVRALQQEIDNV